MARQKKNHVEEYVLVPKKRRWKIAIVVVVIVLSLVGAHSYWGLQEEENLSSEITQLRELGEPMVLGDFIRPQVIFDENAAVPLTEAGKLIRCSLAYGKLTASTIGFPLDELELELAAKVVAEDQDAFHRLREARGKKEVKWDVSASFIEDRPAWDLAVEQRNLAEVGRVGLILAHQRGDDAEAVEIALDLVRQARAMRELPMGIGRQLVACGMSSELSVMIGEMAADLQIGQSSQEATVDKVRQLIAQLLDDSEVREDVRSAVRWDRATEVEAVRAVQRGQRRLFGCSDGGPSQWEMDCQGYLMKAWMLSDARLLMDLSSKMLAAMEGARSWPGFEEKWRVTEMEIWRWRQEPYRHLVAWAMEPGYERVMRRTYGMLTERRLAAAALAIRLYAAEHSQKLPQSLADLIPAYLPASVEDPMAADGKLIGYVRDDGQPRVYSVGENGKDEGGSEEPTRDGRTISRWERADVVVHLTMRMSKRGD